MAIGRPMMRGSLLLLVVSCSSSYDTVSESKIQTNANNGNQHINILKQDKDIKDLISLSKQWLSQERSSRRFSKRQTEAPPEWILRAAAREGLYDLVVGYIPKVDDIDGADVAGWTAMMWAAHNGHLGIVKLLLDHGANVSHTNYKLESALHWATFHNHEMVVLELINRGIIVNQQEENGLTALMGAAVIGSVNITQHLLNAGANKYLKDKYDRTALLYASKMGQTEVKDLLADFENINEKDIYGLTPIHHSVLVKDDVTTLEEGLTHCPNLSIKDINGNTAEDVALIVGNTEAYSSIQRHKHKIAYGCWLDSDSYEAITKEYFDCREFQCHCYGNWTSTGKNDPSCEPKIVKVYSIQEMIAPWIQRFFSTVTPSFEN